MIRPHTTEYWVMAAWVVGVWLMAAGCVVIVYRSVRHRLDETSLDESSTGGWDG
jgi:hypothetical protein